MEVGIESVYLDKLGKGDHNAFNLLYLQYSPKVKHFLLGFIKNQEEVDDMVQELFFKIWTNRQSIAQVHSFQAYLFRMARNIVYDYYEHTTVKANYSQKQLGKPFYSDLIEEELYAKELLLLIDAVVDKMPEQRRKIFLLSRKESLSNEEIADRLNINKRTVENHLTAALSDLRKVIYLFASTLFLT